jgi:hypothetical protein
MSRLKTCAICGSTFSRNRKYGNKQWAAAKYCSRECAGVNLSEVLSKNREPLEIVFSSRFKKTDGCWEWMGLLDGYGYGLIDHGCKRYRAHVLALEYDGRPKPAGMVAMHKCDNPKCVRPDHLEWGTPKQNVNDAAKKDRICFGERSPNAVLSESDVRKMRSIVGLSYSEIARQFNVSRPTATRAITSKTWRRVK